MGTLEDLRNEHRQEGIGVLLQELLAKIVWSTVRRYPPVEYSPSRRWDQVACEDVLGDWIMERLWGRADLKVVLSSVTTLNQLRASLTTSLCQHLTNKCRRSIASNLYKRVRAMLRDNSCFRSVGSASVGADQHWMLAENELSLPSPLSVAELVQIAAELSDGEIRVVRYGPFSQKLSPILRQPELRAFLQHLLGRAKGSLTLSIIVDVMRFRFSLPTEEHMELDEGIPSLRPGPADEAAVAGNARSIVLRLNREEADVVTAYFGSQGSFPQTAKLSGCSSVRVRGVVHRTLGMICELSESQDEASAIMKNVEMLLIQRGDQ